MARARSRSGRPAAARGRPEPGAGRRASRPGPRHDQRTAERRHAVQSGDPEQRCLDERRSHLVEADGRPAGRRQRIRSTSEETPVPAARALLLVELGELGEYVGAQLDQPAPGEVGRERVHRLVADPSTDRRDQPRVRQPGPRQRRPALETASRAATRRRRRSAARQRRCRRSCPGPAGRPPTRSRSPARRRRSRRAAGPRCAQVAYGEPAGLQRSGGWVPHRSRSSSVRRTSSKAAPAAARSISACAAFGRGQRGWSSSCRPRGHV